MTDPAQNLRVDILFTEDRPGFGDLFQICGEPHPRFPPEGKVDFRPLADLQVSQVDDYFGVRALSDDGDDVAIWLYPLVDDVPVDHHPGPFDGLRLTYDLLRNPAHRLDHFVAMLTAFDRHLPVKLGGPIIDDIAATGRQAMADWTAKGLTPGSPEALAYDI